MSTIRQLPLIPTEDGINPALTRHSPLREAIVPFQQYLRFQGKTANTVTAFTSDLHVLAEFAGPDKPLGLFSTAFLRRFLQWLEAGRGVPCSRKSYARRVTTLKVFFDYLHKVGVLTADPAKPLVQRSGSAPLPNVLTPAEIQAVLDATTRLRFDREKPDARPDLLVRLLLDTGIKKSETVALKPGDVDRSQPGRPVLKVRYDSQRNAYKARDIPLDPDWPNVLDEYLAQYQPRKTIFACTARNLEYVLRDVGQAADLAGFLLSFETLRWTSALRDLRGGMAPDDIRAKLGLSRVSWYETYAKLQILLAGQTSAPR